MPWLEIVALVASQTLTISWISDFMTENLEKPEPQIPKAPLTYTQQIMKQTIDRKHH